jgi:HK97 family phage major capsid protein
MNIREMREESLKLANEGRALLDSITADNAGEKNIEFDKIMAASDELAQRAQRVEQTEARTREMSQIVTNVADTVSDVRSANVSDEEKRTADFTRYLRGEITGRELRAMGVSVDAKGGFTVPKTFSNQVISSLQTRGPMMDPTVVNYLVTDGGAPIMFPKFDDTAKAVIVGENTLIDKDDLAFGQAQLGAYKYTSKIIPVSRELLEDSGVDIAKIISDAIAARISRGVNEHLTTGTGTAQPQGIVTAATVGKTTAVAGAITADELIDLIHSVDAAYRSTARFMLADGVVAGIRKLKDSTGSYIWQPGMSLTNPETIFGRAFVVNPDMPATATGVKTVLYGDFKAYTVRQARALEVRRLDERFADSDQVGFVALGRWDGLLTDTGAVRALKQA